MIFGKLFCLFVFWISFILILLIFILTEPLFCHLENKDSTGRIRCFAWCRVWGDLPAGFSSLLWSLQKHSRIFPSTHTSNAVIRGPANPHFMEGKPEVQRLWNCLDFPGGRGGYERLEGLSALSLKAWPFPSKGGCGSEVCRMQKVGVPSCLLSFLVCALEFY